MVRVKFPNVAPLTALSVIVDDLSVVTLGLKLALTPVGKPLTPNETAPVNAPVRLILI